MVSIFNISPCDNTMIYTAISWLYSHLVYEYCTCVLFSYLNICFILFIVFSMIYDQNIHK